MHYKESMCERWMGSRKNKNYVIFLLLFFFSYHLKECIKYGNVILLGLSEFDKKHTYIYIIQNRLFRPFRLFFSVMRNLNGRNMEKIFFWLNNFYFRWNVWVFVVSTTWEVIKLGESKKKNDLFFFSF